MCAERLHLRGGSYGIRTGTSLPVMRLNNKAAVQRRKSTRCDRKADASAPASRHTLLLLRFNFRHKMTPDRFRDEARLSKRAWRRAGRRRGGPWLARWRPRPPLKSVFRVQERRVPLLHLCCLIPPAARDEQESDYIQRAAPCLTQSGFAAVRRAALDSCGNSS